MTCYRCGVTMPDPDYQLEMQWEMMRRAEREAQQQAQHQAQWKAQRRAVGYDLVRPLQDQAQPIPPEVISGRNLYGGAKITMDLATSINPITLARTYPEWMWTTGLYVWLPGRYVVVVSCAPAIPASRLEWFARYRAVSFEGGPEVVKAQRSQPFGE